MRPGDDVVLDVQGVGHRFGRQEVLDDLTFSLRAGERVAFRGPNGAGKTTALRCIAGTIRSQRGTISIAGSRAGSPVALRFVGASLSEERSFYLRMTGRHNLEFFASLRFGLRDARGAVKRIVEELEIDAIARTRVDRCSSGMIQQLALARALLGDPSLLLLDEPMRSLDDAARERAWAALDARPGAAVVLVTHSEEEAGRCQGVITFPR